VGDLIGEREISFLSFFFSLFPFLGNWCYWLLIPLTELHIHIEAQRDKRTVIIVGGVSEVQVGSIMRMVG
jgi:hypothetical protein